MILRMTLTSAIANDSLFEAFVLSNTSTSPLSSLIVINSIEGAFTLE